MLSQNHTTPVSAYRLDRRPPRCVTPYPAFGQPGIAPTTPQKQIPEPPPTAPQTPLRCTHSGGAPAPTAHMSLLYGYCRAEYCLGMTWGIKIDERTLAGNAVGSFRISGSCFPIVSNRIRRELVSHRTSQRCFVQTPAVSGNNQNSSVSSSPASSSWYGRF